MSKKNSIKLSEKHGVNPSLVICTLCGKETNELALLGKLKGDAEAPRHICTGTICEDCKKELEENRLRCFVDLAKGRWIKINDEDISQEYLKKVGDTRWIPIPSDNFEETFCNTEGNGDKEQEVSK